MSVPINIIITLFDITFVHGKHMDGLIRYKYQL